MLRPLRHCTAAIVALACVLGPHLVLGQTANPGPNPGLAGNWVGILDIVHADGSVEPDNAYFSLTLDGQNIGGVAGNNPAHLGTISDGQLAGNNLSFDLVVNPQITVKFSLALGPDHLHGSATGLPVEAGSNIVVDAMRADEA
jgi:hypothetical protein